MTAPLEGLKVVDMSQVFFGPGAAMFLGDQGADVIKVEPLTGDGMRYKYASSFLRGLGLGKCFLGLNRNKRSISVDASTDDGREIVHKLVEDADVYIMNMRPGTEARLGLDYETLSRINPRLVYASISGFGKEGPEARLPAYDIVIQARSGVMSTNKLPDGTPIPYVVMYADISGCMTLSYAIMVALWERERTGKGQKIDASLLHQGLTMQMQQLVWVENDESAMVGASPSAMSGSYRCSDGSYLAIVIQEERQYQALCQALDLPEAATDPRFGTFQSRIDNAADLGELIGGVFGTRPLEEWLPKLKQAGVPAEAVVTRDQTLQDLQTLANGMFWEQDHPHVGKVKMVTPPFSLSSHPSEERPCRPVPLLGEHTDETLAELGYGAHDIARLHDTGVVKGPQVLSKAAT